MVMMAIKPQKLPDDGPIEHGPRPTPTPTPPPNPNPTRLGNPSVSGLISFTYSMPNTQPSDVGALDLEPFPPLPGGIGEDAILSLSSDQPNYVYGSDTATLTAKLAFIKDASPLPKREVIFAVAGETFVRQTNQLGIAILQWTPFGVPGPGDPTSRKYFAQAAFRGY